MTGLVEFLRSDAGGGYRGGYGGASDSKSSQLTRLLGAATQLLTRLLDIPLLACVRGRGFDPAGNGRRTRGSTATQHEPYCRVHRRDIEIPHLL